MQPIGNFTLRLSSAKLIILEMATTTRMENFYELYDELVTKKKSTSVKWGWFGWQKKHPKQNTIFCKVCKRTIATKRGTIAQLHSSALAAVTCIILRIIQSKWLIKCRYFLFLNALSKLCFF